MNQSEIKKVILSHLKDYDPIKIGIFGSFAWGENKNDSDIDILVEFKESPTLLTLIKLENDLSEILGIKVVSRPEIGWHSGFGILFTLR